jgi:hypothetical protein
VSGGRSIALNSGDSVTKLLFLTNRLRFGFCYFFEPSSADGFLFFF